MRHLLLFILVILPIYAQTSGNSRYYTGTTAPVGCVMGRDFWLNTTVGVADALRLSSCTANGVWTVLSGAGGAGTGNVVGPAPGTAGALATLDAAGTGLTRNALTGVIKTAGGVPSVVAGTATDFVRVDGTSAAGGGGGNVTGPSAGTGGETALVNAAGTTLTRSALTGVIKQTAGVPSVVTGTATDFVRVDGTSAAGGGGGNVTGPTAGTGGEVTTVSAAGTTLTRSALTGVIKQTSGVPSVVTGAGTNFVRVDGTSAAAGGTGDVNGASNLTTATRVVVVSAAGTVTEATGCTYASNALTCTGGFTSGDGTVQSGIILPELTANGTNDFRLYGAANQAADGCLVFSGALASGDSWRGSATTATIAGKTCRVMETYTPGGGGVTGPIAGAGGEITTVNAGGTAIARSTLSGVLVTTNGVPSVVTGTGSNFVRVDGTSAAVTGGTGLDAWDPGTFFLTEEFVEGTAVGIGTVFGGQSNIRPNSFGGAAGSIGILAGTAGHPGILQSITGTTAGRGVILLYQFFNTAGVFAMYQSVFDSYWIWAFQTTIANQGAYSGFISPADGAAGTLNNGCWVRKISTDTNFQCVCVVAGAATVVDYGVAPVADKFYRTHVSSTTANTIKFRIYEDGVAIGTEKTISAGNVPTIPLVPMFLHVGTGTNVTANVDKFAIKQTGITNR